MTGTSGQWATDLLFRLLELELEVLSILYCLLELDARPSGALPEPIVVTGSGVDGAGMDVGDVNLSLQSHRTPTHVFILTRRLGFKKEGGIRLVGSENAEDETVVCGNEPAPEEVLVPGSMTVEVRGVRGGIRGKVQRGLEAQQKQCIEFVESESSQSAPGRTTHLPEKNKARCIHVGTLVEGASKRPEKCRTKGLRGERMALDYMFSFRYSHSLGPDSCRK